MVTAAQSRPEDHCVIIRSRSENAAFLAPTDGVHRLPVPLQPHQLPPVAAMPHVHAAVLAAAREQIAIAPNVGVEDERGLSGGEGKVSSMYAQGLPGGGIE